MTDLTPNLRLALVKERRQRTKVRVLTLVRACTARQTVFTVRLIR